MSTPNNIQKVTKVGGRRIVRTVREPTILEKNKFANNIIKKTFTKGIRPLGPTSLVSFKQNDEILSFENPNVRAVVDIKGNHICYIIEGPNTRTNMKDAMPLKSEATQDDIEI
ncbi:hypothetical protein CDIK_0581 [Cucumispora dikerogammari]|nr:hypothetical protein CDIK_0581 [Cucumispora dikerogammari]